MKRVLVCIGLVIACHKAEPKLVEANSDDRLAGDVVEAVNKLQTMTPEAVPEADRAAAIAPTRLLGTWKILHTVYITNGKRGEPSEPLVEGAWSFDDKGIYRKLGGNELQGTYVLTRDRLIISAIGPALDYSVDKLTDTELVVTSMILDDMGSTTTLQRTR